MNDIFKTIDAREAKHKERVAAINKRHIAKVQNIIVNHNKDQERYDSMVARKQARAEAFAIEHPEVVPVEDNRFKLPLTITAVGMVISLAALILSLI